MLVQKLDESLQVVVLLRTVLIGFDVEVGFVEHVYVDKDALKLDCVLVGGSQNNISTLIERRI